MVGREEFQGMANLKSRQGPARGLSKPDDLNSILGTQDGPEELSPESCTLVVNVRRAHTHQQMNK